MSMALQRQRIETGYKPRPLQDRLHGSLKRFNVLCFHRRWGKTVFSVNEMVDRALVNPLRNPQYAYIAPTYGQAERVAWSMLKEYTRNIPGVDYNQQKLTCTIPRPHLNDVVKIILLGAENPDSLRGMYLDGAILDEYAQVAPSLWGEVVRPALSDRTGWAIFIGTPKGRNHFYDILQVAMKNETGQWYWAVHKASMTGILPKEELDGMRSEMSEEQYEQEMECSFTAALIGSYYGKLLNEIEAKGQIGKVPHDPALLVDTAWDLGVGDTSVIWFIQQYRQEIRIIDHYEMSGEGLPHYAKVLKADHRKDYVYRDHHWPHDGGSRDLSTGKERSRTMLDLGVRVIVHKRHTVEDGIDATRRLIPKLWIDAEKCERGITALKNYQKEWDEKNKIFRDRPKHDWSSHSSDGMRLLAMVLRPGEDMQESRRKALPTKSKHQYDLFKR